MSALLMKCDTIWSVTEFEGVTLWNGGWKTSLSILFIWYLPVRYASSATCTVEYVLSAHVSDVRTAEHGVGR